MFQHARYEPAAPPFRAPAEPPGAGIKAPQGVGWDQDHSNMHIAHSTPETPPARQKIVLFCILMESIILG